MKAINQQLKCQNAITTIKSLAHDIRSPILCMLMNVEYSKSMSQEEKSLMASQLHRISGIVDSSLRKCINTKQYTTKPNQPILVSKVITDIITGKNLEYHNKPIQFKYNFTQNGDLITIRINHCDLERMLSNIINNSVEACDGIEGLIEITLNKINNNVNLVITDNGKGMSAEVVQKIRDDKVVTHGKEKGQGLGFKHIREALAACGGTLSIESKPSLTTITLAFPQSTHQKDMKNLLWKTEPDGDITTKVEESGYIYHITTSALGVELLVFSDNCEQLILSKQFSSIEEAKLITESFIREY